MRILVIEDEPHLANALHEALCAQGHAVDVAHDGLEGLDLLRGAPFDLAVLDVMLPRRSGLEVCREARAHGVETPILMLTARDTLQDKVQGLDAGADDYLVKPFELAELLARVRALLRRNATQKEAVLVVGDLSLDPATGEVRRAGQEIKLGRKERALLEALMRNAGRTLSHDQIIAHLWDLSAEPSPEVVRAHVKGLRRAIGDQAPSRLIETVHGLGYRMSAHAPGP
ncbi:response regulator transcription factor [bacterium]|nr:response regulator transcription factor [bacterium]